MCKYVELGLMCLPTFKLTHKSKSKLNKFTTLKLNECEFQIDKNS